MHSSLGFALVLVVLCRPAGAQQSSPDQMSHQSISVEGMSIHAKILSLSSREGLHMLMTPLRDAHPGDAERADNVVETARQKLSKYIDAKLAERDGYHVIRTPVSRYVYHFTNYEYLREAEQNLPFRADHPTSLIYVRKGGSFNFIGVMYYASRAMSPDDLDKRIPLSVARWHAHVNICMPPPRQLGRIWDPNPLFGEIGSIATRKECDEAGGRFLPQMYGWMVHVYLFEHDPKDIWSMDRVFDEERASK